MRSIKGSPVTMVPTVLLLFLIHITACSGFGFRDCAQNFPDAEVMWCFNRDIHNLSDVISMFPDNITELNLRMNKIPEIPPGSFSPFSVLKKLDMSENQLGSLAGGEFRGLDVLTSLNLSCNNISHIHPDTFQELVQLKTLLLGHNRLTSVPVGLFHFLPAIQEFDMSWNKLEVFSCGDSGGSSTLQLLDLSVNNIRRLNVSCFPALENIALSNNTELELQEDVFESNPRLTKLICQSIRAEELLGLSAQTKKNLTWVEFSLFVEKSPLTICQLLKGMDNLERVLVDLKGSKLPRTNSSLLDCNAPYMVLILDADLGNVSHVSLGRGNTSRLYLNNCGLKQISRTTFEGYTDLTVLQLNQNNLVIQKDTFKDLTRLKSLGFHTNGIRDMDPDWFVSLKNLTRLSLYSNNINRLPLNIFSALGELEELYMMLNQLQSITKKSFSQLQRLRKLDLSFNIIQVIEDGSFQNLKRLRFLDLGGNRIKTLTPSTLSGLFNLENLSLHNNHLEFESTDTPFISLSSLNYLQMDYQSLSRIRSIGPHFFKGLSRLTSFSFGHTILEDIHLDAFVPLVKLREMYIEGVVMKTTNLSALFSPLKTLKKLIINFADLDALPTKLMPPDNSLQMLKVKSNHLHTVDKALLEGLPRLRYLDITSNPLSCSCDNAWFKSWATQNPYTQVGFLYNMQCDNDRRSPYLWQFNDMACTYEEVSFNLFITCSVVDVFFVCVCLVWQTQGSALRYLLLVLRARLRGRRAGGAAKFQYDAFISYSSKDEGWVMDQLVPNLEGPGAEARLRVCLHHRDFRPGAAVLDNIETAIYSSRHTICVVTRHFLRSEWCSMEFQLASLRLFCDGSDVLLLLFLEDIPERCLSPYTRLRKIVHKKTYLLWPEEPQEQDAFWVRLIEALRDGEEEEDEGERGEDELPRIIV